MRARAVSTRIPDQSRTLAALALGLLLTLAAVLANPVAAQDRPATFADLAEMVSPAVVNITTMTTVAGTTGLEPLVPPGSPFEDFFRDFRDRNNGPERSSALGSGFVISADGYIVTNNHVIEGADEIEIEFFSGERMPATLVGTDPNTDIAVLKVEAADLPFVAFGDSDTARVGDWVLAVGNPLGQGFSVSAGIVSARNRELSGTYDDYIQTDAAINRGNSGGPLFDLDGKVIGVNTAILSPTGGSIGIGFSMASNVVSGVVDQLMNFGETRRGWLGVRIQDVTADMLDAIPGLTSTRGAMVSDVPDGPAKDGGVMPGDVILTFNGVDIADTRELVRIVGAAPVGATVAVQVLRNGELVMLNITLGRRETSEATAFPTETPSAPEPSEVLGMTLSEITPDIAQQFQLGKASGLVVVAVTPGGDAEGKGILAGDLISEAGQMPVTTLAELETAIEEARAAGRKSILLLIRRAGDPRFVALSILP